MYKYIDHRIEYKKVGCLEGLRTLGNYKFCCFTNRCVSNEVTSTRNHLF